MKTYKKNYLLKFLAGLDDREIVGLAVYIMGKEAKSLRFIFCLT